MSAQRPSRAFAQGRIKALQRIKQPLPPPRNPVARALSARRTGAGPHIRSQGAQRRADHIALQRLAQDAMNDREEWT